MSRECTTTIRGIAILIIIIEHVGVSGIDYRFFYSLGGIGVIMFLFLSGYYWQHHQITRFYRTIVYIGICQSHSRTNHQ